ncbi:MAG: MFS transporter [Hyphomonadaceae bacterium]|nr:MFS transporter [Hyphomonadaceae bacterium]
MTPSRLQSILATPAARMTLVMSALFGMAGVTLVFLPRWLEVERDLNGAQIGAVLSLAQFARIITGPLIARWADSAAERSAPLRWMSAAALVAYGAFFLVQDYWALLALGFVALSLTQGMTPLIEAATLRATAEGRFNYGLARGIGSIAFIVANVAGGALVARFGVGAVVAWVMGSLLALLASTWLGLPREKREASQRVSGRSSIASLLSNRRYVILIVSCGLIQSAHGFYYGFSTLVWRGQGIAPETVGALWAFGVGVEVLFLWNLALFERRFSPEMLIVAGALGGVLRWLAMGFAPEGWVLLPLQAMHMLSFAAAHVGAMRLLYREAPEHSAGMAQTLYAGLSGGLLIGAATLLSGYLYDLVGARGYWAMAAIAAIGGAMATLLLRERRRKRG